MKAFIVTIISGLIWATTSSATNNDNIHFDKELIPCLDQQFETLPVYSLDAPTIFPTDKFDEILGSAAPGRYLNRTYTDNGYLVYDGDRLVGFVDNTTGESTIIPQFGSLNPAESIPVRGIHEFLSNQTIFPTDDTTFNPLNGTTLTGSTKNSTTDATPPAAYLKDIFVDRIINYNGRQFPSCGKAGNKAFFSFGAEGNIHSLSHRWRAARRSYSTVTPLPRDRIYNYIKDQLCALGGDSSITVNTVDVCFYEAGGSFMQPVYRFYATVEDGNPNTLPQHIVGYVAVGDSPPEPVPVIRPGEGQVLPGSPDNSTTLSRRSVLSKRAAPINLGRYVVRDDAISLLAVQDATYFLNGLNKYGPSGFVNSQYYWAEPFVYTTYKNQFINNVEFAYTVGHGSPHTIYTNGLLPNIGPVDISKDIGEDGYGNNNDGGGLRYWIVKGCNVMLSPDDVGLNAAFDPWWKVFNGVHAIMSYRTLYWLSDPVEGDTAGSCIASGAPILSSWMQAVSQDNNGGLEKASAIAVCRHEDDTRYQMEKIGAAGCLRMFWHV